MYRIPRTSFQRSLHRRRWTVLSRYVTVRAQTTTSGSSCRSQDMSQKTRYVACGLMRIVIACKNRTRVRLRLRFAPCETYRLSLIMIKRQRQTRYCQRLKSRDISDFHFWNCRYAKSADVQKLTNARIFVIANKRMNGYFLTCQRNRNF